jgi:hypothetical protein
MNSFVDFKRLAHFNIPCLDKIVHQSMNNKPTERFIFFIPENIHHINFILMFLYYFQFLIIHVNGRISFRSL